MEVVQSSVLGRLLLPVWLWLRARYEYSLLARVLRGIAQAWSRACAGSVLIQFVTREGCLSKAWKDSGLCRILTFLLSIPTILLQKLYGACREAFENSVAARIVFAVRGWSRLPGYIGAYLVIYAGNAVALRLVMAQGALIQTLQDARLPAVLCASAYYFWRRGILGTIVVGMAVYLPLHIGLGW